MRFALPSTLALILLLGSRAELGAQAHIDFWDRAPIRYSDTPPTDRLAKLAAEMESGAVRYEGKSAEGVEGDPAFQRAFAARYPKTTDGKSLADFRLYGRLFKHRCSHMVYSGAFEALPPGVKKRVFARMRAAMAGEDPDIGWLSASERKKIAAILDETLPEWKEG